MGTLLAAALVATGCGGGEKLQLEFFGPPQAGQELLVSVPEEVNKPETAGGAKQVTLECFDRRSRRVLAQRHRWPFLKDNVGNDLPHAHQKGSLDLLGRITRCRLVDTSPALEGELPLAQ